MPCNVLSFKNPFQNVLLKFKKCNVYNVTSRPMFCCHYLENVAVYQRYLFAKVFPYLDIQLCDKNVFKIFYVVILEKKKDC